ncbi:Non-canonical purine NTP phosphatase [uncultured archaeon]|nr:Non-canonical purine NTP phosphatase [uncultured archaeon]
MESGLFCLDEKTHMDITICCVYDGERESFGTSMGFLIPEYIVERIQRMKTDLSAAMEEIAGIEKIGRREGALGYFSCNALKRREQVESCVACAFVPRIARAKRNIEY